MKKTSIDLDVFRRLNERDWEEVTKELEFRIEQAEKNLRTCKPEELNELQVRIKVYEEMMLLPEQVLDREE